MPPGFAHVFGPLGGFTTMVANAAGPVMSLYFVASRLPVQAVLGTAAWFFLIVNAFYSYADRQGQNVFGPDEARFVDNEGTEYVARDLDPAPATALLGFEIPARITRGELVLGGTVDRTSTTGVPYTSTLAEHRTPVNVG